MVANHPEKYEIFHYSGSPMSQGMPQDSSPPVTAVDRGLRIARFVGLMGFLGGAAALSGLTWLGPAPRSQEQWALLIHAMRAIFYPCMFSGIVILIVVGAAMWWRGRWSLNRQPWFRAMMAMIVIFVPTLHLFARSSMLAMRAAVNASDLERAAVMWDRLAWAFLLATVVFTIVAAIGIAKPGAHRSA
jgi:hypothetical protein